MSSAVDLIRADLARAKERVAQIERGERGVRSGPWQEADGQPGAGLAYGRQLEAQRAAVERLELELLQALLPRWRAASVLKAMGEA